MTNQKDKSPGIPGKIMTNQKDNWEKDFDEVFPVGVESIKSYIKQNFVHKDEVRKLRNECSHCMTNTKIKQLLEEP